ncbi:MAG: NAD(+)/NADH kinase [Opitutales bacterium]|nr:NAD(+)/NADH kinase [Opitutales bacterium]
MRRIRSIAIVVNPSKKGATEIARRIETEAARELAKVRIIESFPIPHGSFAETDLCCVVGGDGTLLGVVPEAIESNTMLLGVNLGKLGFLATFDPEDILPRLKGIISGNYGIEERSLLCCSGQNNWAAMALNDLVIRSGTAGLIGLRVFADDSRVNDYSADGLIVATPTGSTAYNLSAGGPIIHPGTQAISITPICPHTLSNRSMILPDQTHIRVEIECPHATRKPEVTVDGTYIEHEAIFPIHITRAHKKLSLVHDFNYSYFEMLRTKLYWS